MSTLRILRPFVRICLLHVLFDPGATLARWRARREARRALDRLDDRLLRDVGLTRDMLERAARGVYVHPRMTPSRPTPGKP